VEVGNWVNMQPRRNREDLDSLLGRGSIGATRRDAILETVLAQAKAEIPVLPHRRWYFAGLGAAAVAAAALFLLAPRTESNATSPFRAKGVVSNPPTASPSMEIECLGGTLEACPTGSLLVVRGSGVRGYVSAWADPIGGGGERIWYFSADSHTPLVDAISNPSTATTRAIKIGSEHVAATYVVETIVTERPMTRDELRRIPADAMLARGQALLTVTLP